MWRRHKERVSNCSSGWSLGRNEKSRTHQVHERFALQPLAWAPLIGLGVSSAWGSCGLRSSLYSLRLCAVLYLGVVFVFLPSICIYGHL
jgi:hypothetical protein